MTTTDRELREKIAESRGGQSRWRCPQPLRNQIVEHARERKSQGVALSRTATELGVSESALLKWVQVAEGRFRQVRVADGVASMAKLALVTPSGYRLEGLDTSTAVEVLRGLGC